MICSLIFKKATQNNVSQKPVRFIIWYDINREYQSLSEVYALAIRFRRSMKVGKGLRLNVSKKGVGFSVGKRGLRQSFHSTGRGTGSIGFPGTGLSYIKTTRRKKRTGTKTKQQTGSDNVDNAMIVEEYHDYIHGITNLHQDAPDEANWEKIKASPAPFPEQEMGPLEKEARNKYNNYTPPFLARIFKGIATNKKKELKQAIQEAKQQDRENYEEWQALTTLAEEVLQGNPEAYKKVIEDSSKFEQLKAQGLQIISADSRNAEMEFQVRLDDVVPTKTLSLTKTGKVSRKKMGKKKHHALRKDFVCSQAIWAARHVFAYLPVTTCTIHVTENKLNKATGHHKNRVLLSVIFDEATMRDLNFSLLHPSEAMENFEHNMNHLITKGFRPVKRISGK